EVHTVDSVPVHSLRRNFDGDPANFSFDHTCEKAVQLGGFWTGEVAHNHFVADPTLGGRAQSTVNTSSLKKRCDEVDNARLPIRASDAEYFRSYLVRSIHRSRNPAEQCSRMLVYHRDG